MTNEAAAFGVGLLVWTLLFGAGATCWFFPEHCMAAGVLAAWVVLVGGLTSLYARRLDVTFSARDRNRGYLRRLTYGLVGAWVGAGWVRARLGVPRGDDLGILALFAMLFALMLAAGMAVNGQLRRPPHR